MPFPRARKTWKDDTDVRLLVFEVLKAAAAFVLAALAIPKYVAESAPMTASAVAGAGALVLTSSIVTAVTTWQQKRAKASTHELDGCLETLHAVLLASTEGDDEAAAEPGVRLTIHVPVDVGRGQHREKKLEQITNYVSVNKGRAVGAGRQFSIHCGVIGEVYRKNPPSTAVVVRSSKDYDAFEKEMVGRWGYAAEDVKKLDASVMSYMAVPLQMKNEGTVAILYVDSQRKGFFTEIRQTLVESACPGIALFVGRRYYN